MQNTLKTFPFQLPGSLPFPSVALPFPSVQSWKQLNDAVVMLKNASISPSRKPSVSIGTQCFSDDSRISQGPHIF